MITPGQWIHMVGIAGAGMSGIARVIHELGCKVTGSDLQDNSTTRSLEQAGIIVYYGHSSAHIMKGIDVLVVSSAIPENNPELISAQELNIPIIKRGQMLAELINKKHGIAVAGAHGKTTTTSMIYAVLAECNLEPTFIVGGELQVNSIGAKLGKGDYGVVEADESDASFLELSPWISVVTNIEDDHLDFYRSLDNIKQAFRQFIDQVKPDGFAVVCGDDQHLHEIIKQCRPKIILYGEHQENHYCLKNWRPSRTGSEFEVYCENRHLGHFVLSIPGRHNALNALAAIVIAVEMQLDLSLVKKALAEFSGTKRRFEVIGHSGDILVVDDYAHHPTEIKATLEAARYYHKGRLIAIFQPHRYTRTYNLWKELGEAFINTDFTIFTEIYAAGEDNIPGVSGMNVYESARSAGCNCIYFESNAEIIEFLLKEVRSGDLVITIGAGDVWKIGPDLLKLMSGRQ